MNFLRLIHYQWFRMTISVKDYMGTIGLLRFQFVVLFKMTDLFVILLI